jgi:hypothetical protein
LAILAVLLLASIGIPAKVFAQVPNSQGLAITPPVFELSANPGDTIVNTIRVDNLTEAPLPIDTFADNFTAIGEEGQVGLSKEESAFSLATWISISPSSATLAAKASKTFEFTIKVPKNAEPGGRFGSVVFSTNGKKPDQGGGVGTGQEVGSLILLTLAGEVKERASIASFKTTQSVFEQGPISFETRIKNQGNVHIKPTGTITISDVFGKKQATIPVNSQNVLPDAIRKLSATWGSAGSFGKYTATLSLQYGQNKESMTASTTFFIIPWRLILAWMLGIAVLAFLLFLGRKRFGKAFRILLGKE